MNVILQAWIFMLCTIIIIIQMCSQRVHLVGSIPFQLQDPQLSRKVGSSFRVMNILIVKYYLWSQGA